MVIRPISAEHFVGFPNHIWDQWRRGQLRVKDSSSGEMQPVPVKTGQDEIFEVMPKVSTTWSWQTRYLTSNCESCPLFIPPDQADVVVEALRKNRRARKKIMVDYQGICGYADNGRNDVFKFLVENQHNQTQGCVHSSIQREERAEKKRKAGRLHKI